MPTTYTNGLKLPDLGSIDWYNSYKNNIDILDPIVGTVNGVATTYAPISHSHSASEITSGTIDIARLPPAALERMHIVADQTARYALTTNTVQEGDTVKQTDTGVMYLVVDSTKLNSADGYTEYSAGTASKAIADEDGTSIKTGYGKLAGANTWTDTNTFRNINPETNSTYSLGSSSYQWSAVYAQSYYYNGTQWGLDKENVWTGNNRFVKNAGLSDISTYSDNTTAFTANANTIFFNTRGSSNYPSYGTFLFAGYANGSAPERYGQLKLVRSTDIKGGTYDGYKPDSSFNLWRVAPHYSLMDFMEAVRVQNDGTENSLKPITTSVTDLGTSTNKWKTINGINPGALSLPDKDRAFTIDTTNWTMNNPVTVNVVYINNSNQAPCDGWLYVNIKDSAGESAFLYNYTKDYGVTLASNGSQNGLNGRCAGFLPVLKGDVMRVYLNTTSLTDIKFFPCMGAII